MSKMNEVLGLREVQEQKVPIAKALVAEFLGLFLLVFFGCGTANGVAAGTVFILLQRARKNSNKNEMPECSVMVIS